VHFLWAVVNQSSRSVVRTGSVSLQFLNATRPTKKNYTVWPLEIRRLYILSVTLDRGDDSFRRPPALRNMHTHLK
jgi:hypothetical protein